MSIPVAAAHGTLNGYRTHDSRTGPLSTAPGEVPRETATPAVAWSAVVLRGAIRDEADRLIGEYPAIPAGSVLRCFARALRLARLQGCPPGETVLAAAEAARDALSQRVVGSAGVSAPRGGGDPTAG